MRKVSKKTLNKRKLCAASASLAFMALLLSGFVFYIKHETEQAEAIIGGADGPTAILVAGTIGGGWVLPVLIVMLVVVLFVVLIRNKNK